MIPHGTTWGELVSLMMDLTVAVALTLMSASPIPNTLAK